MKSHRYDEAALARFKTLVNSPEPVLLALEISAGPWPGFNGVQALVLTEQTLYRVQTSRYSLRPNVILEVLNRAEISDARWTTGRFDRFGRLTFRADGRKRRYVSRWQEGEDLAKALTTTSR